MRRSARLRSNVGRPRRHTAGESEGSRIPHSGRGDLRGSKTGGEHRSGSWTRFRSAEDFGSGWVPSRRKSRLEPTVAALTLPRCGDQGQLVACFSAGHEGFFRIDRSGSERAGLCLEVQEDERRPSDASAIPKDAVQQGGSCGCYEGTLRLLLAACTCLWLSGQSALSDRQLVVPISRPDCSADPRRAIRSSFRVVLAGWCAAAGASGPDLGQGPFGMAGMACNPGEPIACAASRTGG